MMNNKKIPTYYMNTAKSDSDVVVDIQHLSKTFKVYYDKGSSLKERLIFWKRNRYENRVVLNDISLQIKKGETIGLIGKNGCGKSTLLKLMTGIYWPNKGSLSINGRVSSLIELGAGFHPDMSGRENIYTNASIFGLSKKEIDNRLDDIINFSEIGQFIDNPVRTYSSGMYMRLAFSVAINVDADILLIDEILAVGDANFQAKCFKKLRELKNAGITIVIVSHDLSTISQFCSRAIWISDGHIAANGDAKETIDKYLEYMSQAETLRMLDEEERNRITAIKAEKTRNERIAKEEKAPATLLELSNKLSEMFSLHVDNVDNCSTFRFYRPEWWSGELPQNDKFFFYVEVKLKRYKDWDSIIFQRTVQRFSRKDESPINAFMAQKGLSDTLTSNSNISYFVLDYHPFACSEETPYSPVWIMSLFKESESTLKRFVEDEDALFAEFEQFLNKTK